MKKIILPSIFIASSIAIYALRSNSISNDQFVLAPHNSAGAAAGKTGAPGEQNCTACHAGTAQDGANENILTVLNGTTPVTSYIPGQQYNVTLSMSSNPAKRGFQATALTSANTMAGTFTAQTGNTSINGTTKKYANHTSTSNTSATLSWNWTWTAPASGTGDVTFYVATNKTNNNGVTSGDAIYLSQHIISEESSTSFEEISFNPTIIAGWDQFANELKISFDLNKAAIVGLNVIDLEGKSVYNKPGVKGNIGKNSLQIASNTLIPGVYVVNLFIDNKPYSKKVIVF
jgi:hypothetical protein